MLPAGHSLPCLVERVTSGLPDAGYRAVRCRGWPSRFRQPTSRIPGGKCLPITSFPRSGGP